jgi:glycosyltransferase involved in cell wall biosynthesis
MLRRVLARIGVDGLMISPQGKGHARSERHAVEALARSGEHELVVFVREPVELDGVEIVHVYERSTLAWELRGIKRAGREHRLDALLSLSERLPLAGGPPIVVWLFESPLHRIRTNRKTHAPVRHRVSDLATLLLWRRSLVRAAHVAFGSEATRREVAAAVPALGAGSVVYPGVPPGFAPGPAPDRGTYVFHLGSDDPRDNTAVAVEACRRAGVRLLVAGGWRGDGAEALGRVTDAELVSLYRGAAAYLDPTLYEGFGYGVLEAMACGAPVVASNVTSIPEVVGEAGMLCDPRDPDAFAAAVHGVLDDESLAAELRRRGLERAASFTWERTGAGLSAALDDALARGDPREASAPSRRTTTE